MAIYHLEAKVVSRGAGRSACAASAYLSCSHILNDYDGVQHDYTRKQGLVWQEVFLPDMAPPAWQDREVLWNAVEENEKTKDSRLAREFVVALPIELSLEQWQTLLTDFVQNQFVADGMCADLAIHDPDPPGHNPHAHILLTVRPLDESGKWQYKTEKEYLCSRDGEERGFTAAEFKAAQADGWEKQYQYKVGRKKVYMTPSAAEEHGYERAILTALSETYSFSAKSFCVQPFSRRSCARNAPNACLFSSKFCSIVSSSPVRSCWLQCSRNSADPQPTSSRIRAPAQNRPRKGNLSGGRCGHSFMILSSTSFSGRSIPCAAYIVAIISSSASTQEKSSR